jgi:hypothetical protein
LNLLSNPTGNYVQSFSSEKECVNEMNKFIRYNDTNDDIKYIGCAPADLAMNEDDE